ncbi:phage tail tape measure protein [Xanthobacter versatilis]|uniref:hypothetical protein n=1 Tax=Xanthobacter autotrophicus (strain ATCC BAA-1158 / Py2) TaxID=78245 RepID=UPI00372895BA
MDAYKIGVSIALSNGVSPVLGIISKDLLGVHQHVKDVEGGFKRWGTAVAGVAAIMGGSALLAAMGKLVEHGRELVHVQEQMRAAGMSQVEIAEATSKAWENTAKVQSVGVTRNLEMIKELRGVFGDSKHAEEFALDFAKAQAVIDAVTHGRNKDQVFEAAKGIELRGNAFDPEKFRHEIDMMTKATTAYGGKVTPNDFFQFVKYTRGASFAYSDDFMWKVAPALMQEMGAMQAGTALKSMDQAIVGGKLSQKSATAMQGYGLLDPSKIIWNKVGSIKGILPGGIAGSDQFIHDPYEWIQKTLGPALKKHGVNVDDKQQIRTALSAIFGNRTAEQIAGILSTQGPRIDKEKNLVTQAHGLSSYDDLAAKDPNTVIKGFREQWENLLTALGSPLVEPAMKALKGLTEAVSGMAQFAAANPETIKNIGLAIAAISAALIGAGIFAVGAAAFSALAAAPVAAAIGAVVAVVGGLAALNWKGITSALTGAASAIESGIRAAVAAITALGQKILAAIQSFVNGILSWSPGPGVTTAPAGPGRGNPAANQHTPPEAPVPKGGVGRHSYNAVPPHGSGQQVAVAGDVYLDGQKVGRHVARSIVAQSSWASSSSDFDGRMMPSPVDVG